MWLVKNSHPHICSISVLFILSTVEHLNKQITIQLSGMDMKWGGWLWKADNPRWRITFIHLDLRRSQEIERAQQQQVLKWRGWASLSNTNAYMCACLVNHIHNKTNKLHGPACDKFAMRTASSRPCVRTRNSQRAYIICGPACVPCFQRAHIHILFLYIYLDR